MKIGLITVLRQDMLQHYNKAKEHGLEIDVLTTGVEPKTLFSSRKYIATNNLNERIYRSENELMSILKDYDIISAWEFYGPTQLKIMENFDNFVPEIAWNVPTYGTWFYKKDKEWTRECLDLVRENALGIIARSHSVCDCLRQEGIDREIKLIPGCADTSIFQKKEKPLKWRDTKVLLFIGRVSYQKGLFDIFHTFVNAAVNNSVLIYVGPFDENARDISIIKKWILLLGMEKRVLFFHTVDPLKIHEIYNWGDVFITMPNSDMMFTEQIGFTVPQALASGLPVITYDYGGQSEFIDSKVGFKAQYKNYRQAGQKLRELFTDENLLKEMSNNARNKAVGHFSSDLFAKEIKSYYSSLL